MLAALSGVADWQVAVHAVQQPLPQDTAALVLQGVEPRSLPSALPAALPPALPLVLLGDGLQEALAAPGRHDTRPLALLPAGTTAAQLRAALAAVLQGLSVRDAAMPPPNAHAHAQAQAQARAYAWATADAGDNEPLTPRELEVYELVGKSLSNRDIGGVLGISAHTAKFHVSQILAKVGAATRAEAVHEGLRCGLIGL